MKKVTIEITQNGWETKIQIDKKVFIQKHESFLFGNKLVEGDFESEDEIPIEIKNVVSGFWQFNVMTALQNN